MSRRPSVRPPRAGDMALYRRLLERAYPYRGRLILGFLFGLLYAGANAGFVWAVKDGIGRVFGTAEPAGASLVLALAFMFPAVTLVRGIGDFASKYLIKWAGNRVIMDLRNEMFAHLLELPISFFSDRRTGELISRVTNDPLQVEQSVSTVLADIAKEPVTLVAMVVSAFVLDARLALISFLLFPLCLLPITIFGRRIRRSARQAQERIADLMSILQECITNMRIVKAYGMERHERERFGVHNRTFFSRVMRMARAKGSVEPIIVFVSSLGIGFVLLYAHWTHMTVDQIMAFATAVVLMYEPVKKLSGIHLQIQQSIAAAERIFELLDTPLTVADRPGAAAFPGEIREIVFDRVGFSYGSGPVLTGIDLRIPAGTRLALVGNSGSGKTTLVNLVPRFADVTEGAIRINGADLRDLTLASLRRCIGVVTQDTILFNDTVENNIRYGTAGATLEQVREAARQAYADGFVMAMPQGYQTLIGEHGVRLSGGQRQRLAIARAILRNPPIMILDEATSALDTESERIVQEALDRLMVGRTVLVISHRLSTIINADRIIVLDGGRILEAGSHRELHELNGLYRRLHDLQFSSPGDSA